MKRGFGASPSHSRVTQTSAGGLDAGGGLFKPVAMGPRLRL